MKKRKLKKRLIIFLFILLILGIGGVTIYFTKDLFWPDNKPTQTGTEKTATEILEEQGIKLVNKETFVKEANTLLDKGYSSKEINQIYEHMSENNLKEILKSPYQNLENYFTISNFEFAKLDRYNAYQALLNISYQDAVTKVNLNLDEPFYQTVNEISSPNEVTVLVNKSHALPSDFIPDDLVAIPSFPNYQIKDDAVSDFEALLAAAKLENVNFSPYSTYRSYDKQNKLYNNYLKRDPVDVVDSYSARPGHSEHQTGLALDVRSAGYLDDLSDSDYEWMLNNSYKYGFIVRYPKGHSETTGYQEEPWHLRYIGIEHATKVHELGITYDEYYDLYLTEH